MSELTAADFEALVHEVHGHGPFPWQQALVNDILASGRWPDVVDVPTGLGKTSLIDVFVFVAAVRPELARRRLFFVVDRRLIVDEAYRHAGRLAEALGAGSGPCARRVAEALLQAGDQTPLQVTRMRGGVTWSWRWLDRPDRFAVVVGTIDQVGSRLLFRGYGVGEHLRSIDAALVGADSLIVLDEAHLADPFRQTLRALQELEPDDGVPALVTMSATPPDDTAIRVHQISDADEQHPVARRRLHAERRLHLLAPKVTRKSAATVLPQVMANWARRLAEPQDSGRVVAVVCNTVARARAVHAQLDGAVLLTGRIRPVDRDYLLHRYYDRLRAGRTRTPGLPLIVVATQTIEVGANLDVDALVTESADLSALIQRLGRLNRLGDLSASHALVVHDTSVGADDPVYGPARQVTWDWLTDQAPLLSAKATDLVGGLLVSPASLRQLTSGITPDQRAAMRPPAPYTPRLNAGILDAWTRTSPPPHPDTPVAPFLHGLQRGMADVSIVWRAGLPGGFTGWAGALRAVPPATEEMLQVPHAAARRWLAGLVDDTLSDLEGQLDTAEAAEPGGYVAVRYTGPDDPPVPVTATEVKPGDLIVVSAERGGCDQFGWNPASTDPVPDVADLAERRGRPLLRLRPELAATLELYHPELAAGFAPLLDLLNDPDDLPTAAVVRAQLLEPDADLLPLQRNLQLLRQRCTVVAAHSDAGPVLVLASRGGGLRGDEGALESSAGVRRAVLLNEHQQQVADQAAVFAANLGLAEPLQHAVRLAALLHDEGKRDPRFQAMLYQRPLRALAAEIAPRAKSGMDPADRAAFRRARIQAGYPAGLRHEALSARIAEHTHTPGDLVVHLVASHHGRSRPLLPPVQDPDPQPLTIGTLQVTDHSIDWQAPERFARLNRQQGRWQLALLEAIVRLADIWCSERDDQGSPHAQC
ncbi:type I-G CRISPR-associated helicase/endonuclease Cas3g [Actinomadura rupiterrae]|uniref:type I-G CRISPR-associated helicase/endonuclease Cas3g n=1 Tax=Actinomadura rupiterrae TaxID=559627 RepID=UPI0020A4CD67|nr:type I-U CRISPR-associated helicase/endonuclease Cas3 [Actinomadura rupiterrae]MCP2340167.1 CRISPR-associated endonuclease/helicase Cas3 [Actinomadura rupiterrae]